MFYWIIDASSAVPDRGMLIDADNHIAAIKQYIDIERKITVIQSDGSIQIYWAKLELTCKKLDE